GGGARPRVPHRGRRGRRLLLPALRLGEDRAHAPVLARPAQMRRLTVVGRDKMAVFDDMELEHKITVYDKAPEQPGGTYGEWRTRTGDTLSPKLSNAEPLKLECGDFVRLVQEGWDGREMRDG